MADRQKMLQQCLQMTEDMERLCAIVSRGTGRPVEEQRPIFDQLFEYVQFLESMLLFRFTLTDSTVPKSTDFARPPIDRLHEYPAFRKALEQVFGRPTAPVEEAPPPARYRLKIIQDTDPVCYRKEGDPVSRFATWKRGWTIGDEQPQCEPDEWLAQLLSDAAREQFEAFRDDYPSLVNADYNSPKYREYHRDRDRAFQEKLMELVEQEYFILPVYAYEHGGITIRTAPFSCPWDSGQLGWIVMSKAVAEQQEIAYPLEYMRLEIQEYDWYLTGQVWGFEVLKPETCSCDHTQEEVVDSCWGFYGNTLSNVRKQMEEHINNAQYRLTDEDWVTAWGARYDNR